MNAKSLLKSTTANVTAPKATKVTDDNAPISNDVVRTIEQRKSAAVIAKATAKGEIAGLVSGVTSEVVVSDTASGRARAMAIVTLCLMQRHHLVKDPSKRNLSNNDGDKDFAGYLTTAFAACDLDWSELAAKSDGIDKAWRDALAGFVWLHKTGALRLDLNEADNGKYAHLGMTTEKNDVFKIALDINKLAAASVKIDGEVVKADGGIRRASAMEVVKFGYDLLNTDEYWKKSAISSLDVIANFAAYCTAIANGERVTAPALNSATINRLREVAVQLEAAIEAGDKLVTSNAEKAKAMKAEAEKTSEQAAVDAAPKLSAAEKRAAKKADADKAKADAAEAKKTAKVTYLKARKAKSTLKTAKRKAA